MSIKNSFILKLILLIPEKIHIGVIKVVSKIKIIGLLILCNICLNLFLCLSNVFLPEALTGGVPV